LSNLSNEQLEALGLHDERHGEDYCSNPQLSVILPFIEAFGAAEGLTPDDFEFVSYDNYTSEDCPLNPAYTSSPTIEKKPVLDDEGKPTYDDNGEQVFEEVTRPAANLDDATPLWTYYVAETEMSESSAGDYSFTPGAYQEQSNGGLGMPEPYV